MRKSLRFAIYARDKFRCIYCNTCKPSRYLTLDHVKPRRLGGSSTPDNLATACKRCNSVRNQNGMAIRFWAYPNWRAMNDRRRKQLRKPLNRELGRWLARAGIF